MFIDSESASMPTSLRSLLYISRLAAGYSSTEVGRIVKQAREMNAIHGITGVLVFDGDWFAQYVEGAPEAMALLEAHLRADPRHSDFTVVDAGLSGPERRFPGWVMGYADSDLGSSGLDIPSLAQTQPCGALERFAGAIRTLDIF
ncbi:hypothetical protein GCM10027195_07740 [Comamonas sediminis]